MAISLSGMASGLDTESIINQLMAIEQNKVTAVQRRQISVNQHKTDLQTIKTKLDAVKTAANDLQSATLWKPVQGTASSDATKIDVTVLGGAGIGGRSIQVDRLASSAQHGFTHTPSAEAGKLTLYYGTDAAAPGNSKIEISVAAGATAKDIAASINANEGAPVYAAVVKDGATEKLVFSSRKTGSSSDFTVDSSQLGAGSALAEDLAYKRTSAAQHGFNYAASATPGTLSLYYGTDAAAAGSSKVDINVAANATASDVAAAINADAGAPVYATVVNDGGTEKLVFSSRKTGSNSDFTVDSSQLGAGSALAEDAAYKRAGGTLDASIKVDGGAELNPESNVLENIIPGVRVALKGVTASPVSVTTTQPAVDNEAIAKKITALVDAYNAVVTSTRAELTEKRVPTASSTSDLQKGQLFGDSGMNSMLRQLKDTMTKAVDGLGLTGLADLGIGVPKAGASPEEARSGKLVVDQDKLKEAIASDYTKVRELFAGKGATKGMSGLIADYVGTQTGTNGMITGRMKTDDETVKGFNDQITKLNMRMETEAKRLKAQFAAMESALNASQTQQAWLTSQISSLPSMY